MASHTATGEWKSFEIRMRRRRAERLVLRADVAAEAGCLDDARGLIDEARALWAGAPGLADVEHRIANAAVPAAVTKPRRWTELAAATAAVSFALVAAGVFAGGAWRTSTAHVPAVQPAPLEQPVPIETPAAASEPVNDVVAPERSSPRSAHETATVPAPREEPVHAAAVLMPEPSDVPDRVLVPTSGEPITLEPVPVSAPTPPPVETATLVASAGPPAPFAADAPPIQPPQETFVHGVLTRYAKAYSDLDVDAAARVWPSVNRAALTRAFDSLESQQVTLRDCRIRVDGSAAHASCAGSATWTPKVGGREHTDARNWDFDLEKSTVGWQITAARVQNR